ncbi:hypothetical protein [Planctellipticum variicoloris]|uniref:hypothetical protein n=1 Tax=Planctellipticum variicoloris TaxID=3064265 RepID=UPI003013AA45|nr:hypothetical protein SH412_002008 [Planctomycetaceae bacterium SH412]
MAQARRREAWDRTADLMAHLGNLHAGQVLWTSRDFHPFAETPTELPGLGGFAAVLPQTTLKASPS